METQADQKIDGNFHRTVTLTQSQVRRGYSIGGPEEPDRSNGAAVSSKDITRKDNKSNISKHLKYNLSFKTSIKNQGCVNKHVLHGKPGSIESVENPEPDQNNNSSSLAPLKGNSKGPFNIKIRQRIPKSFANKGLHIFLNKSYSWQRVNKVELPIQRSQTLINQSGTSRELKSNQKKILLEPIKKRKLVIRKFTLAKERKPLVDLRINTGRPMTLPPLSAADAGDTVQTEGRQFTQGRQCTNAVDTLQTEGRQFTRQRSQSFDAGVSHGLHLQQQEMLNQSHNVDNGLSALVKQSDNQVDQTLIPFTPRQRTKKIRIYQTTSPNIHNTNYQGQVIERLYGLNAKDRHHITTQDRVEKFMIEERNKDEEPEDSDNMSTQVI